jgi:hypothetical protein
MTTTNTRARQTIRLGLESLEGRTVPTATLSAPASAAGQFSAAAQDVQVQHLQAASVTTWARFGFSWGAGTTGAVLTGTNALTANHKSTGSVALALVRGGMDSARVDGSAVTVPVGFLMTSSSAKSTSPDHYSTAFSLTITIHDAASGKSATLTFKGTLTGTTTWESANLKLTLWSPQQHVTVGNHVYTVTLPKYLYPHGPNDAPVPVYAQVKINS